jgi:hypothetical protein
LIQRFFRLRVDPQLDTQQDPFPGKHPCLLDGVRVLFIHEHLVDVPLRSPQKRPLMIVLVDKRSLHLVSRGFRVDEEGVADRRWGGGRGEFERLDGDESAELDTFLDPIAGHRKI